MTGLAGAVETQTRSILSTAGRGSRRARVGYLSDLVKRSWLILRSENILRIGTASLWLLLIASGLIYLFELREGQHTFSSLGDALWYGIVTMTTVGYGDYTPHTGAGRIVAATLIVGGMTLLSLFTGTVASIMVAERIKKNRGQDVIDTMKDHVLVCGWNQHAGRVLERLFASPTTRVVLVNEMPEATMNEVVLRYREPDIGFVHGDPALEAVLNRAQIRRARSAIVLTDSSRGVAMASDQSTTLVTLALKSLNPNIKVTAEALDVKSETHLKRAGADDIVITGEFNGFLLSSAALTPGIPDVVRSVLSDSGTGLRTEPIPPQFVGRTFSELFTALRSHQGFLTLAIVTESKSLSLDDLLTDDYSLVDQFIKQQFSDAGVDFLRFENAGSRVLVNPSDSYEICQGDTAIGIPRAT